MGIFAKIKKAWFDTIVWETIDDEFYDELEDSLIMADLGATVAHDAVKKLRDVVYQKSIQRGDDVKQALRDILIEKLNVGDTALDLSTKPSVVLLIGVNGVGKTTSIGKIAHRLKGEGKRVLLCAADTFRAAAADQLEIWANRAECEIVRSKRRGRPRRGAVRLARRGEGERCRRRSLRHGGQTSQQGEPDERALEAPQDHRPRDCRTPRRRRFWCSTRRRGRTDCSRPRSSARRRV